MIKFTISFIVETDLSKSQAYEGIVKPAIESMMDIIKFRFDCPVSPFSVSVEQGDLGNADS